MRTFRCFLCAFVTGFSLATVMLAFKHGKLLVRTNVARADVYLQDTLLAKTDAHRRLLVEQIPEGTYTVQIRKDGYVEFRSVITMTADRTVTVHATLQPEKAVAADRPEKADKPDGEKTKSAGRVTDRGNRTAEHARRPSAHPPAKPAQADANLNRNPEPAQPVARGPSERARPASGTALAGIALGTLAALGLGAAWVFRRRRPNEWGASAFPTAATPPTAAPESQPTPHGFMRDLRRKEELFEAGLIPESRGPERRLSDPTASQTTIEVSRDQYRYEENSDG